jgi:hypothetical protein
LIRLFDGASVDANNGAAYFLWSFPGSPVRVEVRLGAVQAAQRAIAEPSNATEGVLIGAAEGATTRIDRIEWISEGRTAASVLGEFGADRTVGYCRVSSEYPLRLNAADHALAESVFTQQHQVFLLVKPAGEGPAMGTFFFRDGGILQGDVSLLEFPFDAGLLLAAARNRNDESVENRQPEAAPAPPRPPVRRSLWMAAGFLSGAGIAAGALWLYGAARLHPWSAAAGAPLAGTLNLHPERRQNGDLYVSWGPLPGDASATLEIRDKGGVRRVPLESSQLRAGSLLYAGGSDQLQIDLTVSAPSGQEKETFVAVLPRSPGEGAAPEASPAPVQPEPDTGPASRGSASVLRFVPAVVTYEVNPLFPPQLRGKLAKAADVEVRVSLDETGRIVDVQSGGVGGVPPLLMEETIRAVRQWRFGPARFGSVAVRSQVALLFRFRPEN